MNKIELVGRLTDKVELKMTKDGTSVCGFSIAVKRPKVKDVTDFFDIVAWRQTAEYVAKYSNKGDRVAVCGVLTTRTFEAKDGKKVKVTEINADECEILSEKPSNSSQVAPIASNGNTYIPEQYKSQGTQNSVSDADLPF